MTPPCAGPGLVKLLEAMPTLQRLIFVVPAGIFEDFEAQQLVSSGSYPSPWSRIRPLLRCGR